MPKQTDAPAHALTLLDDLRPLTGALYQVEAIHRPDGRQDGRGSGARPSPVQTSVLDAQRDAERTLGALLIRLTHALGLDSHELDVSRTLGLPCPKCAGPTLRYRNVVEDVYCSARDCRDERGYIHTWPKKWLANLGREVGQDIDRPMTALERVRARVAFLERENARLRQELLERTTGSATMGDYAENIGYDEAMPVDPAQKQTVAA